MKTYLILPEIFLNYFTSTDSEVLDEIEKTLKQAESGRIKLLLPEGLFFLLAIKLESQIKKRDVFIDCLESILNLHNLKVRNELVLRKTVLEMRKGKSFIESYKSVILAMLALDGVIA
ncbi:MAG: hypothetical protein E3J78_04510 [Candidatus Cloacimonadota bacterium]|jgi:hypothetical protein|nr:MAG: hypothetical protein E3J78_04510 [Candidatus Cloacimonadota bacterium]